MSIAKEIKSLLYYVLDNLPSLAEKLSIAERQAEKIEEDELWGYIRMAKACIRSAEDYLKRALRRL